jgi:mRNA interferase RelE/StbE
VSTYRIDIDRGAVKELAGLDKPIRARLIAAIDELAQNPRPAGCTKLVGTANDWRIRVGDYRIIYEIHDTRLIVLVVRVAHRREVYRK